MPDGVVQWFDPATGDAAIKRSGRIYSYYDCHYGLITPP